MAKRPFLALQINTKIAGKISEDILKYFFPETAFDLSCNLPPLDQSLSSRENKKLKILSICCLLNWPKDS